MLGLTSSPGPRPTTPQVPGPAALASEEACVEADATAPTTTTSPDDNATTPADTHTPWAPLTLSKQANEVRLAFSLAQEGVERPTPEVTDWNEADDSGRTPLFLAAESGDVERVHFLLTRPGIAPGQTDNHGWTPLHVATKEGHADVVSELLRHMDVNLPNRSGATPLLLAVQRQRLALARRLVEHGADLRQADKDGTSPFHAACQHGHGEMVRWLWQAMTQQGARDLLNARTTTGATPLQLAAASGNADVVQFLLGREGVDACAADDDGWTPLHKAAQTHNTHATALLLRHIDVNTPLHSGASPLLIAISNQQLAVAELLLNNGADIHQPMKDGTTPLHHACVHDGPELARWLLERPDILQRDGQPCDMPTVLNHTTAQGSSPLLLAAGAGNTGLVDLLLGQDGIDPNRADAAGWSPVHEAARAGHADIVALLMRHPLFNLFQRGPNGLTLLHCAVIGPNARAVIETAQALLPRTDFLALCNTADDWGVTPGSLAAQRDQDATTIRALPMTPVVPPLKLKATTYERVWLIVGDYLSDWNVQELIGMGKDAGLRMHSYGDGLRPITWTGLRSLKIQPGDLVICQCHGRWDDRLQRVMLTLGADQRVPLVDVARLLLAKGVTQALFLGCEIGQAAQPMLQRVQNDPAMARPASSDLRDGDLAYTLVGAQGPTLLSLTRDAAILALQACAAQRRHDGPVDAWPPRWVQATSTLGWNATQQRWTMTPRASLQVHEIQGLAPAQAAKVTSQLLLVHAMDNRLAELEALLTAPGVDPNAADDMGWTALHVACSYGRPAMAALLLRHGADIDQTNDLRHTPLHMASHKGDVATVRLLLRHGARVDPVTRPARHTPLMVASSTGHARIVQLLLDAGADRDAKAADQTTAWNFARAGGHDNVIKLLKNRATTMTTHRS